MWKIKHSEYCLQLNEITILKYRDILYLLLHIQDQMFYRITLSLFVKLELFLR